MDVDTNSLVTNHPGAVPTDRRGVGTNLVGRQRHGGRVCGVYLPGTVKIGDDMQTMVVMGDFSHKSAMVGCTSGLSDRAAPVSRRQQCQNKLKKTIDACKVQVRGRF